MELIAWLKGVFSGRKVLRPVNDVDPQPIYVNQERIGGGLTPEQVTRTMAEADQGYLGSLVTLANECRLRDGHLQSILGRREGALAALPWQIVPAVAPGKKKPTSRDQKIADWCNGWLSNFGAEHSESEPQDLTALIKHLQGAVYHGHGVAQTLYEKKKGKIVPVAARPIQPHRFVVDPITGRLKFWEHGASFAFPGIDLLETFPGQFIVYQPRMTGGGPTREGLMHVLIWAALFRNWSTRDWMQLGEMAWKPWRIGYYTQGANAADKAALTNALQRLLTSGVAILPETTKFHAEWAKTSGAGKGQGQHHEVNAYMAAEMSKTVLGATLSVDQGNVGTQALGRVHADVAKDITRDDARGMGAVLRRQLLAPAVRINFGQDALVPGLVFPTDDAVDLESHSRAILNYAKAGVHMKASEIRDTAGFSEPVKGDEIVGVLPATPDPKDGDEKPKPEDDDGKKPPPPEDGKPAADDDEEEQAPDEAA